MTVVDGCDIDAVRPYVWHAKYAFGHWYARNRVGRLDNFLHRALLNPSPDMMVDHIDGDGLNNRRSNLRVCTNQQNQANRGRQANQSGFRGVRLCGDRFRAEIKVGGKTKKLGCFALAEDAAKAYDTAARECFGEFSNPNFPEAQP